jgi:hypothetical protein
MLAAAVPLGVPVKEPKSRLGPGASVQTDWYGWLPDDKLQVFRGYSSEFEASYLMLSISLDEAVGLRDAGSVKKSLQVLEMTPSLCARLSDGLQALLAALEEHARHYGLTPSVEPLDSANFLGARGQRSARVSSVLSMVLFSQRLQFLSKLHFLRNMVLELAKDFADVVDELASGALLECSNHWSTLIQDYCDVDICFKESMVLLKCFLRVLPADQLPVFQKTIASNMLPPKPVLPRVLLRHRRTPQFAGE